MYLVNYTVGDKLPCLLIEMGASFSEEKDGYRSENRPSVVCDECGRVFSIASHIICGADKIKRCDRPVILIASYTNYNNYIVLNLKVIVKSAFYRCATQKIDEKLAGCHFLRKVKLVNVL